MWSSLAEACRYPQHLPGGLSRCATLSASHPEHANFLILFVTCPKIHSHCTLSCMPMLIDGGVDTNGCMAEEGADIAVVSWQY